MIQYDRGVLQEMAEALYQKAESLVAMSALKYGCLGGILGAAFGSFASRSDGSGVLGFILGGIVGAIMGAATASTRAFLLKVEAQKLLCQAEIEANTKTALSLKV